jgi:4-amino-4-deoxy-L-arabinose transferase-like glycosyltransferase
MERSSGILGLEYIVQITSEPFAFSESGPAGTVVVDDATPPTRRWHRLALATIVALAAFLELERLWAAGYPNVYYAAAIKSMLESWHNFFFVSFDPGGFVTVDKPPLGFWIQAASAKLLGFSGFSILLPEALAGVLSVAMLYVLVRRVFGPVPGLLAAFALAITPISVVTDRNNTIDSLLVCTLLLAAYALSRAVERGSLRWLLLCAVLVGLAFNIKMLEAYLVVPAFALTYLLAAPLPWGRRLWHLLAAGVAIVALSLSWVLAVDLTPAALRPYVGSSTANSELQLALGYNGVTRLTGGPGGAGETGARGVLRLFDPQLGGQTSWLLPLGLVGLFARGWQAWPAGGLRTLANRARLWPHSVEARRAAHLTPRGAAWVLWSMWTLTMAVFFSVAGFFHVYYLTMLAPGVAALAGIGLYELWRDFRLGGWRAWLLPTALVVTAAGQTLILAAYPTYSRWLSPLVLAVTIVTAALLLWMRFAPRHILPAIWGRPALLTAALGALALVIGPSTWTAVSLASSAGQALPSAGPRYVAAISFGGFGGFDGQASRGFTGGFGRRGFPGAGQLPSGDFPGGFGGFRGGFGGGFGGGSGGFPGGGPRAGAGGGGTLSQSLLTYLEQHQGSATYLFATLDANSAAPAILATGKPVMALGGFTGSDPILSLDGLKSLIHNGTVRYFVVSGRGGGFGGGFGGAGQQTGNGALVSWIESTCAPITAAGASASGVYDCAGAA